MAPPLIILIAAAISVLALKGWPVVLAPWLGALVAWAAILLGLAAIALRQSPSRSPRLSHVRRPGPVKRMASALWISMALGLCYLLLLVLPPLAREASDSLTELMQGDAAETFPEFEDADPAAGGDRDPSSGEFEIGTRYNPEGAFIPKSARLTASDKPEISLILPNRRSAESLRKRKQLYVHAFSFHAFDGQRWMDGRGADPKVLRPDAEGWIQLGAGAQEPAYRYTVLHHLYLPGDNTLNTLQGVQRVKVPQVAQLKSGTCLLPPLRRMPGRIYQYAAASSPRLFEDLLAESVPVEAGVTDPLYLAPSTDAALKLQVEELAQRFQGQPQLQERLVALKEWFVDSAEYTTEVDYPEDGRSAVGSFLAEPESRKGFCVHFASATALLLRELGVPSRVTYGWAGGEYHPGYHEFVFRGSHAHAWAEIWLKDQGWVVFDTTPHEARPEAETAAPGAIPPTAQARADVVEKQWSGATGRSLAFPQELLWVLLGLVAFFLLTLLLSFLGSFSPGHPGSRRKAPEARRAYLQVLQQLCAKSGHPKPEGRTWLQHLAQLRGQEVDIAHAEELIAYHYEVAYRGSPRDRRLEKRLCRQLEAR
ncbi:MAG: transglutaminase-like domain-containing protein [Akkermansiaceae bacterium]|nr:transglutaminase-like domain-containing protein [Akkermansiaceae bacterium]